MAESSSKEATKPIDDLDRVPQQNTSVEPGVPKVPMGDNINSRLLREELDLYTSTSPKLSGGDVDAAWEQADSVGEEAVGGTVATPDQSVVEELGEAVGLVMDDRTDLRTIDIMEERDDHRWELDPTSSEDYAERRD